MIYDKTKLDGHWYCSTQFQKVGEFVFSLLHNDLEPEEAGRVVYWAICNLADTGYVRKGMLTTLDDLLADDTIPDEDKRYAKLVRGYVDNYDFGLERTPKNWHRKER